MNDGRRNVNGLSLSHSPFSPHCPCRDHDEPSPFHLHNLHICLNFPFPPDYYLKLPIAAAAAALMSKRPPSPHCCRRTTSSKAQTCWVTLLCCCPLFALVCWPNLWSFTNVILFYFEVACQCQLPDYVPNPQFCSLSAFIQICIQLGLKHTTFSYNFRRSDVMVTGQSGMLKPSGYILYWSWSLLRF